MTTAVNANRSHAVQATAAKAAAPNPNAILNQYKPTGASEATARQDGLHAGVAASHKMAQTDLKRLEKYKANFETAAKKTGLPPALLAAIASRESRGGAALDSRGYGDHGNGYGLMQVDKRYHSLKGGPYSEQHIEQAAGILKGMLSEVKKKHPDWPAAQQLRGAVAAYNSGVGNVQTIKGMDVGTTGNDYSNDVWARAQELASHFGGTGAAAKPPATKPPATKPPTGGSNGTGGTPAPKPGSTDGFDPKPGSKWKPAPALADVKSGKATLQEGMEGGSVKHMQKLLGIDTDGKFGPGTKKAVVEFQKSHGLKPPPGSEGHVGKSTLAAMEKAAASGGAGPVLGNGVRIDTNNPTLKKLATQHLDNGKTGYCVLTTLNNMRRLGVPGTPAATGMDPNNPRGGMAQMLRNGQWASVPFPGSHQKAIHSPYGNATANVVSADQYRKLVAEGKVPSGAIIFQTRHGWDYSGGSSGNDMGVVRNGGKTTHNYADMPGIVYSDCKEVVIMVPKDALKRT